jgi:hypothetical protein
MRMAGCPEMGRVSALGKLKARNLAAPQAVAVKIAWRQLPSHKPNSTAIGAAILSKQIQPCQSFFPHPFPNSKAAPARIPLKSARIALDFAKNTCASHILSHMLSVFSEPALLSDPGRTGFLPILGEQASRLSWQSRLPACSLLKGCTKP